MDNILGTFIEKIRCVVTEKEYDEVVHYSEDYILFYIYDKEKIIKDKQNYESQFNRVFDGKTIRLIIQQPIRI